MLVLSRDPGDSIIIQDQGITQITVTNAQPTEVQVVLSRMDVADARLYKIKPNDRPMRLGQCVIKVFGVNGRTVKFGIEAPRHIKIDRLEVWERKQKEAEAKRLFTG